MFRFTLCMTMRKLLNIICNFFLSIHTYSEVKKPFEHPVLSLSTPDGSRIHIRSRRTIKKVSSHQLVKKTAYLAYSWRKEQTFI